MANAADAANYQLLTLTKGDKEIVLEGKTTSFDYYESLGRKGDSTSQNMEMLALNLEPCTDDFNPQRVVCKSSDE